MKGDPTRAFLLLIDDFIFDHIITCAEKEAFTVLGMNWNLTKSKLKAFIGILYARGAYEGNTLRVSYLWNNKWGPPFFAKTMSRREFTEILRFVRFDEKSTRLKG